MDESKSSATRSVFTETVTGNVNTKFILRPNIQNLLKIENIDTIHEYSTKS
jgi:hypothetical protein